MRYECVTKCFYGGRLYEVGDTAEFSAVSPPSHFIPVGTEEKPIEKHGAEPMKKARMAKAKSKG